MDVLVSRYEPPLGIYYWTQIYMQRVPRFEVFEYLDSTPDGGLHFFRSRDEQTVISKRMDELERDAREGTFKPFLINLESVG